MLKIYSSLRKQVNKYMNIAIDYNINFLWESGEASERSWEIALKLGKGYCESFQA